MMRTRKRPNGRISQRFGLVPEWARQALLKAIINGLKIFEPNSVVLDHLPKFSTFVWKEFSYRLQVDEVVLRYAK